jgi:hypothetical protein
MHRLFVCVSFVANLGSVRALRGGESRARVEELLLRRRLESADLGLRPSFTTARHVIQLELQTLHLRFQTGHL